VHVLREGSDVTIVTWGAMTIETLRAVAELDKEGISAEVIDLATLSPIDSATILASVAKTGRLVIVHEAVRNLGVGAEIAAIVAEHGLYDLQAPIQRVTGFDTIMPLVQARARLHPERAADRRCRATHLGRLEAAAHDDIQASRFGRGLGRGRDHRMACQGRRSRRRRSAHALGGNGEIGRGTARAVRRRGRRAARRGRRHRADRRGADRRRYRRGHGRRQHAGDQRRGIRRDGAECRRAQRRAVRGRAVPVARALAKRLGVDLATVDGTGAAA
jgi:pyruvate/2-oxoglutarate dehydrogenase complex dihydrolipoamide acyltransferase (E2) component